MKRMLIAIVCAILFSLPAITAAGPIQSELAGYRCVVPDWSKTSGGHSPALSPDGKTLVYISQDNVWDKVWVISDLDKYSLPSQQSSTPPRMPEPWELDIKLPDTVDKQVQVTHTIFPGGAGPRNADWSPDGKLVAFIYEGRLFIAEDLNQSARSAKSRMLADVTVLIHGDKNASREGRPLESPRWSPDGTKIAFIRPPSSTSRAYGVSVLDVGAGKETVVARDAMSSDVWGQPWSPDSKSLVYAAMKLSPDGRSGWSGGISIVPVDGGEPRRIIDQSETYYPSWSPTKDRLAYMAPYETTGIGNFFPSIYIADVQGKGRRPIARYEPTAEAVATAMDEMRSRLQEVLRKQYPGVYTEAQLKRFMAKDVTDNEVMAIIMMAEAVSRAKEIGGEFQRRMEAAMKAYTAKGDKADLKKDLLTRTAFEAIEALPEEQRQQIQARDSTSSSDVMRPLTWAKACRDQRPMWSPDGAQIAFVRWNVVRGEMQLLVADVSTGKTRPLFEENTIGEPVWTFGGRSLVVEDSRNLAYAQSDSDQGELFPRFITMPSYPEIWVLDLK